MAPQLSHVIVYVADMEAAVAFYRDIVGFEPRQVSPEWSEFATGETTLALHRASEENPPGSIEAGLTTPDAASFYRELSAEGVDFPKPPRQEGHGILGKLRDRDGAAWSVGEA